MNDPQVNFPPIIWIFTEGEGDRIESRLPFKIFSTLKRDKFWEKTLTYFVVQNTSNITPSAIFDKHGLFWSWKAGGYKPGFTMLFTVNVGKFMNT